LQTHHKTVYLKAASEISLIKDLHQLALKSPCQIILISANGQYPEIADQLAELPVNSATVVTNGKIIGTATSTDQLSALLQFDN